MNEVDTPEAWAAWVKFRADNLAPGMRQLVFSEVFWAGWQAGGRQVVAPPVWQCGLCPLSWDNRLARDAHVRLKHGASP